jgi:hypothetical protein
MAGAHAARRDREDVRAARLPWHDGDPHIDDYRRWRPEGDDELPAGAAKLLTARSDEAGRLRSALGELGVIVREDGRRQYWRLTGTM